MSWAVHARRVRDETLSPGARVSALHSLIASHHAPFGFLATAAHLRAATGAGGGSWTGEQLRAALSMLEESRASHLAYRAAFAERRSREKAEDAVRPRGTLRSSPFRSG